jgi:hypothetical protein
MAMMMMMIIVGNIWHQAYMSNDDACTGDPGLVVTSLLIPDNALLLTGEWGRHQLIGPLIAPPL